MKASMLVPRRSATPAFEAAARRAAAVGQIGKPAARIRSPAAKTPKAKEKVKEKIRKVKEKVKETGANLQARKVCAGIF